MKRTATRRDLSHTSTEQQQQQQQQQHLHQQYHTVNTHGVNSNQTCDASNQHHELPYYHIIMSPKRPMKPTQLDLYRAPGGKSRNKSQQACSNQSNSPQSKTLLFAVILYNLLIATSSLFKTTTGLTQSNSIAPSIDYSHNMRVLKLPKSTPVGSLIYRLKGSDGDPNTQLSFGVSGTEGRALLDVFPVAHSWNEADVYLRSPLEQSAYNLTIYVTDGNKTTQVESTIYAMDYSEDLSNSRTDPFVEPRHVFHVPENAMPDETVGSVTVLESQKSDLPVRFELRGKGADHFAIKYVFGPKSGQSKANIVLAQALDYETQNLFNLKVLALNSWTRSQVDTRNVATLDIVVTVGDCQDTGPVFKNAPHSLRLPNTLKVGAHVLKVEAQDGDYADQRAIQFALEAGSPLANYFDIDKLTGDIRLTKPIQELALHASWDSPAWSTLVVFATEVADTASYDHLWPPMYSKLELPIHLVDLENEPPQFIGGWQSIELRTNRRLLHAFVTESQARQEATSSIVQWYTNTTTTATTGSPLLDNLVKSMGGKPIVLDLGLGSNGTFELLLEGRDAQLFHLEPVFPVTRQTTLNLWTETGKLNRSLFDYDENRSHAFELDITARDFGSPKRLSSRIHCLIELVDLNDNAPQFESQIYTFSVYENAQIGQLVGSVRARDPDTGQGGRVKYASLSGPDSQLFRINPDSGQLTVEGQLDRERKNQYMYLLGAHDTSFSNYSQILIDILDVNDNAPVFLQAHYEAVLSPDGNFHEPLVVRALDADEPGTANSQVAYEIIAGNQNDQFTIDSLTGHIYPLGAQEVPSHVDNKPANVIPEIPSILSEPIVPFPGAQGARPTPTGQAGKILPSHEVEDTTYPSRTKQNPHWPRTADSTSTSIANSNHSRMFSPVSAAVETSDTSQTKIGRLSEAEQQVPVLDLLMSLESDVKLRRMATGIGSRGAPVTTLVVRAHDFGIPLRSSTVKVSIYNQALMSRSVSVIVNGTAEQVEMRRDAIERAFGSVTGSRAVVESVEALSESSSISVIRVRLTAPQHSLVDLTDLTALMKAIDYQPFTVKDLHQLERYPTHYIVADRVPAMSSNITNGTLFTDIQSFALDSGIERRLLIYIIIVAVCILALLVVWMIYTCSREDKVKLIGTKVGSTSSLVPAGSYRLARHSSIDAGGSVNKTYPKTADAAVGGGSPISNNLVKQRLVPSSLSRTPVPGKPFMSQLIPNTAVLKPDRYSMYNGQVWFEPASLPATRRRSEPDRRASSAPSVCGSLEADLHSAIRSGESVLNNGERNLASSVSPRPATGQFFPNTVGYMENLAAMAPLPGYDWWSQAESNQPPVQSGSKLASRHRKRRVAPFKPSAAAEHNQASGRPHLIPSKPPRLSVRGRPEGGISNGAFEQDLESRRLTGAGSPSSGGSSSANEGSIALDSDQELLGFDSTGTPIIATRARTLSIKPSSSSEVLNANTGRAGTLASAVKVAPPEIGSSFSNLKPPPGGAVGAEQSSLSSDKNSESTVKLNLEEADQRFEELRSAAKADIMSELSEKLHKRGGGSDEQDKAREEAEGSEPASGLRDMKNGELLEKQSIFAITYNGLATDKLPEG